MVPCQYISYHAVLRHTTLTRAATSHLFLPLLLPLLLPLPLPLLLLLPLPLPAPPQPGPTPHAPVTGAPRHLLVPRELAARSPAVFWSVVHEFGGDLEEGIAMLLSELE